MRLKTFTSLLCLSSVCSAEIAKCVRYSTYTVLTSSTTTKTLVNVVTTYVSKPFSAKRVVTLSTRSTSYIPGTVTDETVARIITKRKTYTVGHTKVVPKSCPAAVCKSYSTKATTITKASPSIKTLTLVKASTRTKTTSPTVGVITSTSTSGTKKVTVTKTVTQSTSTSTVYTFTDDEYSSTVYAGTTSTTTATYIRTAATPTATITAVVFSMQVVETDIEIDGYTIGLSAPVDHDSYPFGRNAVIQNDTSKVWQYYVDPATTGIFELSTGLRMYRDYDTCDGCYTEPVYFLADGVPEYQDGVVIDAVRGCQAKCGEEIFCNDGDEDGFGGDSFGLEDRTVGAQLYKPGDFFLHLKAAHPTTGR